MCVVESGVGRMKMEGLFFFFEIKTMIVLPKTLSNYVTRKEINECANGNTWVLGG